MPDSNQDNGTVDEQDDMRQGAWMLGAFLLMFAAPGPVIVPAGETFTCTPTRVWDGDGPVWCAEGPRLRLAGVAAREMDGTCRDNQPCPTASAQDARDALVALLGVPTGRSADGHIQVHGAPLTCRSEGSAGGTRTAAWCASPTAGDLSCALVATKTVLVWQRYWRGHRCDLSRPRVALTPPPPARKNQPGRPSPDRR